MNKAPKEIKIASTILIVLGILLGLTLVPLTLVSGPQILSWIYTILPSLIFICFLIVMGIGILHSKRWAWWIAQIILSILSLSFLRFIILGFFSNEGSYNTSPPPNGFIIILFIVSTVIYLLFSKNAMAYLKFEESVRPKSIRKVFIISVVIVLLIIVRDLIFNT